MMKERRENSSFTLEKKEIVDHGLISRARILFLTTSCVLQPLLKPFTHPEPLELPYLVPVTTQKNDKANNEVSHPGTRSGRGRHRRLLLLVLPTTRRVPKSRERSQAHERRGQDGVTRHHHDHVDAEGGEDVHAEGGEDVHAQGREGRCYSTRC